MAMPVDLFHHTDGCRQAQTRTVRSTPLTVVAVAMATSGRHALAQLSHVDERLRELRVLLGRATTPDVAGKLGCRFGLAGAAAPHALFARLAKRHRHHAWRRLHDAGVLRPSTVSLANTGPNNLRMGRERMAQARRFVRVYAGLSGSGLLESFADFLGHFS